MIRIVFLFLSLFSFPLYAEQPFVMVQLTGQLGNELFQIAAGVSLALDHDARVIVPQLKSAQNWGIPLNRIYVLSQMDDSDPDAPISKYYEEPTFRYRPIPYHPNMSIHGYFQSEKYFVKHKESIIDLFSPNETICRELMRRYPDIIANPETVAIHVRTYHESDPNHRSFYLNGRDYVRRAMAFFPTHYTFIIFSDDIEWCKKNLTGLSAKMRFIEKEPHYIDFYLMSFCRHQIISNSSFSWWAAYLNKNPNKIVVAPKKWFKPSTSIDCSDLIPAEWVLMD